MKKIKMGITLMTIPALMGSIYCFNYKSNTTVCAFYAMKSPVWELPADEEKNVGKINRRDFKGKYDKEVYLTFDDGPSRQNTVNIMDILLKNGVKASFFIVGNAAERNKEIIQKLDQNDMCILPHSHSHDYSIYKNTDAYFEDLYKNIAVIENLTGRGIAPFMRMPGGSTNTIANKVNAAVIKNGIKRKGLRYVDWNVSSTDASAITVDSNIIKSAVISKCKNLKFAVVLMHDAPTKTTTVQALPEIIKFFKENGYEFRTFKDITPEEEEEMVRRKIINR